MMQSEQIIAIYETVSDLTGQMLVAAKSSDWDSLAALEAHCAGHVRALKDGEPAAALSPDRRARKIAIIHQILAHDRQIRDLTQPWMVQLSALMHSAGTERKLSRAYEAQRPA
jgi:flagellar protein FliT